jgi:hypothetical protein
MSLRISLIAAYLLSFAGIGSAGVIFRVENEDLKSGGQMEITEMKVDGNRMRADSGGKDSTTMIFLGDTDEMYVIDHKEKSYMVMDRETVESLGNQMSAAMKQMEEALKDVPPEQRAMMERMMKGKMKGMPASKPRSEPQVRSLGESDSVNGVGCDWNEVSRDGVVELKACVCDWTDIPGGDELRQISLEMKDFASALVDAFGGAGGLAGSIGENPMSVMEKAGGFPLITENFQGGNLTRRSRFQSVEEVAISDDEFMPPSGYKKKDMGNPSR